MSVHAADAIDQIPFATNGLLIEDASHCTTQMTGLRTAQNAHPLGLVTQPPLPGAGETPSIFLQSMGLGAKNS